MISNYSFQDILLLMAFLVCGSLANAQLPNEKFGKPSKQEWEFTNWDATHPADAIILCKTIKVTYELPNDLYIIGQEDHESLPDGHPDFGTNQNYENDILVQYEVRLRTKILKPEGARHANIDILYYDAVDDKFMTGDEVADLSIKIFTKDEKGKVRKKSIATNAFDKERVNDNYMVMHVVVPDVQAGSIIEYEYKVNSFRNNFLYDWAFQECIPMVHTKYDVDVPVILQFKMDVPTSKLVNTSYKQGRIIYDANRRDFKRAKSCPTNHYIITGDYILPSDVTDPDMKMSTSRISYANAPAYIPEGWTHLKIK